jgi:hypothetical protein
MQSPIDTQFFSPRLPISIVALPNSDYEANGMRQVLEMFNCVVTIHWIGTPGDFLKVLGQGESAPPYLLIAGHGEGEKGYYLGEYADFIDTSMLREEHMPPEVIAPVVNLPNCTVISSSCGGGVEAMGRAFVETGRIGAYIGCRHGPDAEDLCVFLVNFFHSIMRKKLSTREAWLRAMRVTDHADIYKMSFYHADGTVEHYEPGQEAHNDVPAQS